MPLRKFLFSSDAFGLPELYYLGTLLFRRALSAFLRRLDADDMSYADAERVTGLIGARTPPAYRLTCSRRAASASGATPSSACGDPRAAEPERAA